MFKGLSYILLLGTLLGLLLASCKHEPILVPGEGGELSDLDPDTIPDPPPIPVDDCDSTLIYFNEDIAPIFSTSCGSSNVACHISANHEDHDVDLSSWWAIINSTEDLVDTNNPYNSDILDEIIDGDMPPPSSIYSISQDQIDLIFTWMDQGASNDSCESNTCDTVNVSFAQHINPIINAYCVSCHSGSTPSAGLTLSGYDNIVAAAANNTFLDAIKWQGVTTPMPYQGDQLNACYISQIEKWIEDGMPNN